MVRALYTLRWQIELLFKHLNSIVRVVQSDTGNAHRLRCELYGKLIAAVWIHRIHAVINNALWNATRREISMEKLYKRLQERGTGRIQQSRRRTNGPTVGAGWGERGGRVMTQSMDNADVSDKHQINWPRHILQQSLNLSVSEHGSAIFDNIRIGTDFHEGWENAPLGIVKPVSVE